MAELIQKGKTVYLHFCGFLYYIIRNTSSSSSCNTCVFPVWPKCMLLNVFNDMCISIINAAQTYIGNVRACLFHLCQSVFRRVQSEGLQEQYNDENDRTIKEVTQMMCALAFVPTEKAVSYTHLDVYKRQVLEALQLN